MKLPADILQRIEYERCARSFAHYAKCAWKHLEPHTPLDWNWHLDAIAAHLEAVTDGQIKRLLINIPPRFLKSNFVNVLWPTWEWAHKPVTKYLTSSYDADLSTRDNVKSRDLMKTPWYQGFVRYMWERGQYDREDGDGKLVRPDAPWGFKGDQNVKGRYENTEGGHRIATSVGGAATGDGGDRVMVDDPLSAKGGLSEVKLEEAITWWDRTMSSRLNDQRTGAKLVVMQRLAVNDLSGHVLAQGGWDHLLLPMEYKPRIQVNGVEIETRDYKTSIGYVDPRTEEGELLHPERFDASVVAQLKVDLGPIGYAGQYGQSPVAEGGNMFQRAWFEIVEAGPRVARRVRYWDKAGTEGGGKNTAGVLMSLDSDGVLWIEDIVLGQWGSVNREKVIKQTAEADREKYGYVQVWVEQEPGSGGKESAESTVRNMLGFDVQAERVTGDKETRARPLASQAAAKNVKLVRGAWNQGFLNEAEVFPRGEFKDQVDAASGACNKLALGDDPVSRMRALTGMG